MCCCAVALCCEDPFMTSSTYCADVDVDQPVGVTDTDLMEDVLIMYKRR